MIALDLFAGTGWGVACERLGIEEYGVELMPEAIATRDAAGMRTIYQDVWDGLDPIRWEALTRFLRAGGTEREFYTLLIASPPCQTFSVAGGGAGRRALDNVLRIVGDIRRHVAAGKQYPARDLLTWGSALGDDRTALVLTPLLYALRDTPEFIVFEQVPTVLPVWEACADVLRDAGYSVVTEVLNAEQYGVPQTRKRAILFARRDGVEAKMPTPTHSRYYSRDASKLDPGVQKWVSMAEALGFRDDDLVGFPRRSDGREEVVLDGIAYRARDLRSASEPAQTVTEKARSWNRFTLRPEIEEWKWKDAPATTVAGDPRITAREHHFHGEQSKTSLKLTAEEATRLQSYPEDFPFQGAKTKRFLQIGNAVPPLLAQAILEPIAVALAQDTDLAAAA